MAIDNKIKDEKLYYDINREAAQILALPANIYMDQFLTGEEILLPDQRRVIKQSMFAHSSLNKAFGKQIKRLKIKEKNKKRRLKSMGNN